MQDAGWWQLVAGSERRERGEEEIKQVGGRGWATGIGSWFVERTEWPKELDGQLGVNVHGTRGGWVDGRADLAGGRDRQRGHGDWGRMLCDGRRSQ